MLYSDDYSLPISNDCTYKTTRSDIISKIVSKINKKDNIMKFKHQTQPPDRSQNISNKILQNITLYYSNGQKSYEGDPNGFAYGYDLDGKLFFAGFCKNKMPHGIGKMFYPSGKIKYSGTFVNGYRQTTDNNVGITYYENGVKSYEGEFNLDNYTGKGKFYDMLGELKYEGDFVENVLDGLGQEYLGGKIYYEGRFYAGLYEGFGKMYYPNGQLKYFGEFEANEYKGYGKEYYENGGLFYNGEYKNGVPHGQGKIYDKEGNLNFSGRFRNDMIDGKGTLYASNGLIIYEGDYKNDIWHGLGNLYFENSKQIQYSGNFVNNEFEGDGVLFHENGHKNYSGKFKAGEPVYGNIYDETDFLMYTGEISNRLPNGKGTMYFSNDTAIKGNFIDGEKL